MKTPVIETERLILRPLFETDAEHIFKTWASDPRVTEYMIYSTHENSEFTREWLKSGEKKIDSDEQYDWGFLLKETGTLIGSGGAYFKPDQNAFSIGYNFAYDYWHRGFCTEAMKAVIEFLHEKCGAMHIVSDHAVENPRSGEVMKKLGLVFDRDGEYTCFDGRVFKAKYYRLDF